MPLTSLYRRWLPVLQWTVWLVSLSLFLLGGF